MELSGSYRSGLEHLGVENGLTRLLKVTPNLYKPHIKHINIPHGVLRADPRNDKRKDTANVPHKAFDDIILRFLYCRIRTGDAAPRDVYRLCIKN